MSRFTYLTGGKVKARPPVHRFHLALERSELNAMEWDVRLCSDVHRVKINGRRMVTAFDRSAESSWSLPSGMGPEQWSYACDIYIDPLKPWTPKKHSSIQLYDVQDRQIGPMFWLWSDYPMKHQTWLWAYDSPSDMWGPG